MEDGLIKVKFPLENDVLGIEAEWMWARWQGENVFELDNSPFHAYGISFKDSFSIEFADDTACFGRILRKEGHRTVRARFPFGADYETSLSVLSELKTIGCSFEGSDLERPLYSIDVPPGVELALVVGYLAQSESEGILEYEEADCY